MAEGNAPLSSSITPSFFHTQLKTYLFYKSFPPNVLSLSVGLTQWTLAAHRFLAFPVFVSVLCSRLSWFLLAFDCMLISHYYLLTYTTLSFYPSLGQAPSMLAWFMPIGLVVPSSYTQ